ncbi:DUF4292 domain-containing protein [Bacteroidetes/Chlorobi group bacterium ChocPot_Mid]|jgi:hypothetical protein|nr:MAG: DUF4292 domain-containing protein [Bacteroidetes/Chlorobi group bacterium ChocPot_Mid]
MKTTISLLIIGIVLISCSTVKQTVDTNVNNITFPQRNTKFKDLSVKSSISASMKDQSMMASANMMLAQMDSISMNLSGPFGIPFGKLYATKDYVLFYNIMTNQVLEGKPTPENMRTAVFLPLSYEDFIRLIRCETPGEPQDFVFEKNLNDDEILFKNSKNPKYIEFAVLSKSNKVITQYQRKDADGTLILHVFYMNYTKNNGIDFSQKQLYKFPELDVNLTLEITELKINPVFEKPFSFSIPANIDRIKLDGN